jgi:hypothetical protein
MTELTLESLAARLEAVEKKLAAQFGPPCEKQDWRKVVGMFDGDPEFFASVVAEGQAIREADRKAAREGNPE